MAPADARWWEGLTTKNKNKKEEGEEEERKNDSQGTGWTLRDESQNGGRERRRWLDGEEEDEGSVGRCSALSRAPSDTCSPHVEPTACASKGAAGSCSAPARSESRVPSFCTGRSRLSGSWRRSLRGSSFCLSGKAISFRSAILLPLRSESSTEPSGGALLGYRDKGGYTQPVTSLELPTSSLDTLEGGRTLLPGYSHTGGFSP